MNGLTQNLVLVVHEDQVEQTGNPNVGQNYPVGSHDEKHVKDLWVAVVNVEGLALVVAQVTLVSGLPWDGHISAPPLVVGSVEFRGVVPRQKNVNLDEKACVHREDDAGSLYVEPLGSEIVESDEIGET